MQTLKGKPEVDLSGIKDKGAKVSGDKTRKIFVISDSPVGQMKRKILLGMTTTKNLFIGLGLASSWADIYEYVGAGVHYIVCAAVLMATVEYLLLWSSKLE